MERLCFVLFYPRILFFLYLWRSEEHTSELQSQSNLVCRLLLEKKKDILFQENVHVVTYKCALSHLIPTDALKPPCSHYANLWLETRRRDKAVMRASHYSRRKCH